MYEVQVQHTFSLAKSTSLQVQVRYLYGRYLLYRSYRCRPLASYPGPFTRAVHAAHTEMTRLSQPWHKVVTTLAQGCHNAVLQPCHNLGTTLAQPCILKLSQGCDKVVRTLSQGCPNMQPCDNLGTTLYFEIVARL